jgi:hypothetical protein
MKPGRIPCLIIGCNRTAAEAKYPPNTRIICGKCWRLAEKYLRRRIRHIERLGRKMGIDWDTVEWDDAPPGPKRRVLWLHSKCFDLIVKSATERKVGITA